MTDEELTQIIQNHAGRTWWNVSAYMRYVGWEAASIGIRSAVDDLDDVIDWLRAEKQYDKSDRIRTIRDRLNESQPMDRSCRVK